LPTLQEIDIMRQRFGLDKPVISYQILFQN
jgi:hypothetical protein